MQIKLDEAVAFEVAAVVSLAAIEDQYGDDAYGGDAEWAEKQPDLGKNAYSGRRNLLLTRQITAL